MERSFSTYVDRFTIVSTIIVSSHHLISLGVGWGLQLGAEVTDVMLVLSTDAAVDAFKSRAQVSVGAELGVSVGPVGRSIASDVTAGNKGAAHAFSYAHSKGLFFGASLEASGIDYHQYNRMSTYHFVSNRYRIKTRCEHEILWRVYLSQCVIIRRLPSS